MSDIDQKDCSPTDLDEIDSMEGIEAAVFRRLINHLQRRPEAQNIDLMLLADFCRNCLSEWYREAATERGCSITEEDAKRRVYGMTYAEWKANHQLPVSPEKLAALKAKKAARDE